VWFGREITSQIWDEHTYCVGLSYPAVLAADGTLRIWRDGQWIESPGCVEWFSAGPDWQEHCPHEHGAPWRTCDSEADCVALKREEGDGR
jgi:hypothetical protein